MGQSPQNAPLILGRTELLLNELIQFTAKKGNTNSFIGVAPCPLGAHVDNGSPLNSTVLKEFH